MKNSFSKKITALLIALLMVVSLFSCGGATTPTTENPTTEQPTTPTTEQQNPDPEPSEYPENGATPIIDVEKTAYAMSAENTETLMVAHYENMSEILLIDINVAINVLFNDFVLPSTNSEPATVEETDTSVIIERESGEYCEIDFVKDTVYFSDFDLFTGKDYAANPFDLLAYPYVNEEGESVYFQRDSSFFTPGYGLEIDLGERELPLDIYNGKKYIALQTFSDLFISPFGYNVAYNGQDIFILVGSSLSEELAEVYYLEERTERSEALVEFTFNELCLCLDLYYGMKNEHGFNDGFAYYLESIGLKDMLFEKDAVNSFNAIGTLTLGYIADLHSAVSGASPYLGAKTPDASELNLKISNDYMAMMKATQQYEAAREAILGEVLPYQKIGNTAYVTFDSFTLENRTDYSEETMELEDTIALIIYAHAQIMNDEEIENVVLDLSCNGGGAVDAAIYVVAWMLGSCELSIYNSITESRATTNYSVDVNLDGVFDERDTISSKNLYCIVSPSSFSCGNLVPSLLKASGRVTILGRPSGGGACAVHNAVAADGTRFQISSPYRLSTVKNGTYYSVDEGVEPDIVLTKTESFYDREALTEYINDLK